MTNRTNSESTLKLGLKNEAKRLYVDATYSGRGHMQSCERWEWWDTWLGVPVTIISSILAAGAAVSAFIEGNAVFTAIMAGTAAILNGLKTFLQPDAKSRTHGVKGNQYLAISSDARIFLEVDLHADIPVEKLIKNIKDLRKRYNDVKKSDPQLISRTDYETAKRNIKAGESNYTNDPLWKELSD